MKSEIGIPSKSLSADSKKSRKKRRPKKKKGDDSEGKGAKARKHGVPGSDSAHKFMGLTQRREFGELSTINTRAPNQAYHPKVKHVVHRDAAHHDGWTGDKKLEGNKDLDVTNTGVIAGHPGEIHGLIYVPHPSNAKKVIETSANRLVDYILLIANFCSVVFAMFPIVLGLTVLSFTSSMQSILDEDSTDLVAYLHVSKELTPGVIALILIIGPILQICNAFTGVYCTVQGFKTALFVHLVVCILFVLVGTGCTYVIYKDSQCNTDDLLKVQDRFFEYIRLFGTDPPEEPNRRLAHETSAFQLDSIQIGISCCGALSWADYMNPLILQNGNGSSPLMPHIDLDEVETVFPSSCCRPWWVRNVHCSKGAHLWAHPAVDEKTALKFRQRINQTGCIWRIKDGCERILLLIQLGLWVYIGLDFILFLIKLACISIIETVIWRIIKKKKAFIASDLGHTEVQDDVEIETPEGRVQLPTEDEIHIIKARTDFNKFLARTKRTQIGKWIKQARKSIYLSFPKPEAASQPENEAKPDANDNTKDNPEEKQLGGVVEFPVKEFPVKEEQPKIIKKPKGKKKVVKPRTGKNKKTPAPSKDAQISDADKNAGNK